MEAATNSFLDPFPDIKLRFGALRNQTFVQIPISTALAPEADRRLWVDIIETLTSVPFAEESVDNRLLDLCASKKGQGKSLFSTLRQ